MTLDKPLSESEYFRIEGGVVIPSLMALRTYLRTIPISQFNAHVTSEKNDFANWVEHVFGEMELGKRFRSCISREQMVWALDDAFANQRMEKVVKDQEVKSDAATQEFEDDKKFDAFKSDITMVNEKVSSKYEVIAKQMQDALSTALPKDIEQRIEKLKIRYAEIMSKISETRKQGKDTLIPALVVRQFVPKLTYAQVTREENDFKNADAVLEATEAELREVQNEKELNVKKEVLALAGINT